MTAKDQPHRLPARPRPDRPLPRSPAPGQSAATKPIAFDDFIRVKRVTDLQLSPDGASIAFVVTVMDKAANRGASDIWIVPGARRRAEAPDLEPGGGHEPALVARRPDDRLHLDALGEPAGLADRSERRRGGPAHAHLDRRLGRHLVPARARISPSSRRSIPDCPDDESNRKKMEEAEASKVKGRVFDHLLVRHWNAWWDGTRSHLFVVPAAGGTAVDVTPGDFDAPPIALGGAQDYDFSPDGTEIAFVRNIDPEFRLGLGTNNDIFVTGAGGGEAKKLTANKANDHSPRYSPDGRYLAYLAMARPGFEADKQTPDAPRPEGGDARSNLTGDAGLFGRRLPLGARRRRRSTSTPRKKAGRPSSG